MMKDVDDALGEDADHMYGQREQHHEEKTIISPSNAVVQPWTVVVKSLNNSKQQNDISETA